MARRSDHSRDELHRMALKAAQKIVAKSGLRGLSTRRIASAIGYSPGTLYQLFSDLDDLIVHLNAQSLAALYMACQSVDFARGPEAALQNLAERYINFVSANPRVWNAVFEHSLPEGRQVPEEFSQWSAKLLGLAETAIAPLYRAGEEAERRHDAEVLWAGLYGIASLATANKLGRNEAAPRMVRSLIANYLAGLRALKA